MLEGKTIVLGVTGSIAAYKIANLASMLIKLHAEVHVVMTQNATNFINPITFETLTNHKCLVDTFDRNFEFHVGHVSLAKKTDLMLIAPASANVIGKIAGGIADDMLTTTVMACKAPILISPAMNTNMYENAILQENLVKLKNHGMKIIEPDTGLLACRDVGAGKMPQPEILLEHILREIAFEKDLADKRILVTAGATVEAIDPVRFISNHSTGKMGYAIAKAAAYRGARVTLVSGKTALDTPLFVNRIDVVSAKDMYDAVMEQFKEHDILIMAAAVADYTPAHYVDEKIKKTDKDSAIPLVRTKDIIEAAASMKKQNQFVCGFSMETQNMIENSKGKLEKKHLDMIVANNLKQEGAGFATDTNVLTLISKDSVTPLSLMSKEEAAHKLLDEIVKKM
ncbi:bifunctional phosphopantothenoylcysteine decarboxylase/phosphopantothenate--cysteine ligase CoaBC [Eubacterium oxidoreducens]|uniref:Coenzyme A biosynthesis bifunctional protein CoaBC n=1 Tax=Eubacterium oxidoreducens TaxID=1732 RepID=A0A1G6BFH7_EUBOX|nr:bifunctional phosphopantothenoylcysteine decarboxylase/phosphopantothenate--cysteine ligase CoaBC [Eubacterium oxidoreducens]SDB19339.1 phosphopantothenoylcysteine decarboxylase / phosphopantothenate--cysteine ligase [Eubacterium oxidoreducens]